MAAITARALAALIAGKQDSEIIKVRVKHRPGRRYYGHVADLLADSRCPDRSTCTIVTDDNDLVWNVSVTRIEWIDVQPRPAGL